MPTEAIPSLVRSLTPRELAARWRCRVKTVRMLIRSGELPAFRIGKSVRISPEAVLAAERGLLAVRQATKRKREAIPREVADLLNG